MIAEMLQRWDALRAKHPHETAVIDCAAGTTSDFAALDRQAARKAESFPENWARRGVVLHLPNGREWLTSFLALRRKAAVVIPVDYGNSAEECQRLAQSHRAAAIINEKGVTTFGPKNRKWKPGVALIKHTSGTTGRPRSIAFTEEELCADADNICATMQITREDRNFGLLPLGHSYALGNLVLPLLARGVALLIGSSWLPRVIADEIRATRATVFPSVPPVLDALTRTQGISLHTIRLVISAAAPLDPELARRFKQRFGQPIHNFYGASECGAIAYDRSGNLGLTGEAVGEPVEGVALSITAAGQVRVVSRAVSAYAQKLPTDHRPTVTLKDQIEINDHGQIIIKKRSDRVIKCGGRRVNLTQIEQVVEELPGISRAASLYDAESDRIHLFVEQHPDSDDLKPQLRKRFPALGGRIRTTRLTRLPVTLRGKVDYRKLRARA